MLVIAHRGASQAEPENTVAAFRRADVMGADGVELDVRVAGDGALVVAHDPLPRSVARGGSDSITSTNPAPFLPDALDACGATMLVNTEIKNFESEDEFDATMSIADRTIDALRARGGSADRWLISSFSWATIDHCRRVAPEFATAALCRTISPAGLERVADSGHFALNPHHGLIDAALMRHARGLGLAVNAWTVNDAERMRELFALGVDGLVTAVPDHALVALGRSTDRRVTARWGTRA